METDEERERALLEKQDQIRMRFGYRHPDLIPVTTALEEISARRRELLRYKTWRELNPDKVVAYYQRIRTTGGYKGKVFVRNLIMSGIRIRVPARHGPKLNFERFAEYVGCTPPEFHKHIESQFLPKMNWCSRGINWVHRFRLSWADVDCETEEGKKKMAHFSNVKVMEIVQPEEFIG